MIRKSIESILNEIFFNGTDETISMLKAYELYEITQKKITFFNDCIDKPIVDNLSVVYISFIQSINTKLNAIKNTEDKEHLKYILSNIGNHLIDELLKNKKINIGDLKKLEESLKEVYNILGYDFEDFQNRTQFTRILSLLESQSDIKTEESPKIYYEWNGGINHFDEVSRNLKSENSIQSIKDFKKLFSPSPVKVNFNKENSDFITILFDALYENKIIKPKVKRGHLAPLKSHAVDFENNVLFNKSMKQTKYTIKKNTAKYDVLRSKAEKWMIS